MLQALEIVQFHVNVPIATNNYSPVVTQTNLRQNNRSSVCAANIDQATDKSKYHGRSESKVIAAVEGSLEESAHSHKP